MSMQHLPVNDMMGGMGAVIPSQSMDHVGNQPFNTQLLEQQFKLTQLQQLQQLQNQIFQQQLAIISGQNAQMMQDGQDAGPAPERQAQYHGLPTPGPSSELRAQQSPMEFVSPMVLSGYMDAPPTPSSFQDMVPPLPHTMNHYPHHPPRGSMSAPANVAFHQTSDLDFDVSPLTSPWLGPGSSGQQHGAPNHGHAIGRLQHQPSLKRRPSPGNEEGNDSPARKKAPGARPVMTRRMSAQPRGSRSTNSTPLLHPSAGTQPDDSPSPVDLSMPPPAPPPPNEVDNAPEHLMPVTPSIMMNMPRFAFAPSTSSNSTSGTVTPSNTISQDLAAANQNKASGVKRRGSTASAKQGVEAPQKITKSRSSTRKSASGSMSPTALVSPGLKAILPAGGSQSATAASQLPRKSHKAAEQKRRDSMKTTIDELRGLLPAIPLPSAIGEQGEAILPGALPPRGPPKAGGEGPNKGVSKLQLLMCSNEYIRRLNGRIARRDEEIDRLRAELRRLRFTSGPAGGGMALGDRGLFGGQDVGKEAGVPELELDRDLDVGEEAMTYGYGQRSLMDEDEEDGED